MGGVNDEEFSNYDLNNEELRFGDLGITEEKFREWEYCGTCILTGQAAGHSRRNGVIGRYNRFRG